MKLLPKTIELLESELQSCDPYAYHIAQNQQGDSLALDITSTPEGEQTYDEYLINCFLFLLEAHDSAT